MQTVIDKLVPAQLSPRKYLTQFLDAVSMQLGQVGILIAHEEKG